MTIEHTDLSSLVSQADLAELRSRATAVRNAMAAVKELHGIYNWCATDEIKCRGCGERLEIPYLRSTNQVADRVLAEHQQAQLQLLLGASPWPDGE